MQGPHPATRTTDAGPIRLVGWILIVWGLAIAAIPLARLAELPNWSWLAWGIAAVNLGLGVWALRRRRWLEPMFAALYLLAFAMVAVGPLTSLDIYPTAGVICLCVLSVGAAILHRMGPPRD